MDLLQNESDKTLNKSWHVGLPNCSLIGKDEAQGRGLRDGAEGPQEVGGLTGHTGADVHHVENVGELAHYTVLTRACMIKDKNVKSFTKNKKVCNFFSAETKKKNGK